MNSSVDFLLNMTCTIIFSDIDTLYLDTSYYVVHDLYVQFTTIQFTIVLKTLARLCLYAVPDNEHREAADRYNDCDPRA